MDAKTGFFYLFSVVLLYAAFRVITARNPVHAVLHLILAFSQAAGVSWNPRKPEEFANYTRKPSYVPEYTWHERMSLSPFTLSEVNKGYLVQNPGY